MGVSCTPTKASCKLGDFFHCAKRNVNTRKMLIAVKREWLGDPQAPPWKSRVETCAGRGVNFISRQSDHLATGVGTTSQSAPPTRLFASTIGIGSDIDQENSEAIPDK